MAAKHSFTRQSGFTLLEALISMLVIALGLLGLAGLQVRMQQAEFESYQRTQALVLLYDVVERIQTNRMTARCFAISDASGTTFLGTGGTVPGCALGSDGDMNADAVASMTDWHNLLLGASEKQGAATIGALVDARGCISYNSASELPSPSGGFIADTGIYTVTIAWQGTIDTVDTTTTVPCANSSYSSATQRRVVSTTFRLANLK